MSNNLKPPQECGFCLTPVLIQTIEMANQELSKLRAQIQQMRIANKIDSDRRYELEAQIAELLQNRTKP